jgi:CheY-like chemotaxis protein
VTDSFRGSEAGVLNVHAEPGPRRRLTAMLEEAGFEVTEACDGREALARAARNPPALIPTRPAT